MENEKNKILVVDDEIETVDALTGFLSRKGYEVNGVFSGEEALGVLENQRVDLMLLDLRMAGLDGRAVAKIVKEKYPFTKVIIVTGYAAETQNLSEDELVEDIFIKPVGLEELYKRLLDIFSRDEPLGLNVKLKQGITARLILIKAKLLFIEPSLKTYGFLEQHFKNLSYKGESFRLDLAKSEEEIIEKLILFEPDIVVANESFFGQDNKNIFSCISASNLKLKEILYYNNIKEADSLEKEELEKLTKSIEIACFKHGLIEIQWIEV